MATSGEWRRGVVGRCPTTAVALLAAVALIACDRPERSAPRNGDYALGHAADSAHIVARNTDVGPDAADLPAGSGSVAQGATLYGAQCASCHGPKGEGMAPSYPPLVGRNPSAENFVFGRDWKATRTIGNYWPYASTVFDYVKRAMPHATPGSLSNDDVYALTAWLLSSNGVVADTVTLDAKALAAVKMPYQSRFVRDNRRGGREVR